VDRRRSPRLERSQPPRVRGDPCPSLPVVINASTGGVCLWMPDSPSMHCRYVICWRAHDRQQVIGLRPVWLQPSAAVPAMGDVRGPEGWLAGFAFAPETPGEASACLPQDILADPQVAVESLLEDLPSRKTDPTSLANNRWTLLSDGTKNSRGVLRAHPDTPAPSAHQADPQLATHQAERARRRRWAGRTMLVGAGLVAAVIGWMALTSWIKADRSSGTARVPWQQPPSPRWAIEVDPSARERWINIQSRFDLPDGTILTAVRVLKTNDKYPLSHWLRDLTPYPAQVERAFAILAGSGRGGPDTLGRLVKDLEMRLVSGSPFPDEAAGNAILGEAGSWRIILWCWQYLNCSTGAKTSAP